jgi:hypothetical protein
VQACEVCMCPRRSNAGKANGPIPLANIKRAETCDVPSDKGFGLKVRIAYLQEQILLVRRDF